MNPRPDPPASPSPSSGRRSLQLAAVLVLGVVLGAVVTLVVQDRGAADAPATATAPDRLMPVPATDPDGRADPVPGPPTVELLLAWRAAPMPADLAPAVATLDAVERTTAVRHATVGFVGAEVDGRSGPGPAAGAEVPIDLIAVDPMGYPAFVPADLATAFAGLDRHEVILGRTGAELRGLDVGDIVHLTPPGPTASPSVPLTVVAVVDDAVIGGAELAVGTDAGRQLGLEADRYLLVAHHGDRAVVEAGIRELMEGPVRFRGPGETPYLRDGDAVLPQAVVKATFGEFAVQWTAGGPVQDPSWPAANLVEADVAVLGRVRCHRGVIDDLRAAMDQVEREHLAYLIDPTPSSRACSYADVIERTGALSRGYWGIAVVLNSAKNPTGSGSVQDPRIVAILQEHGFTWGGDFLVPEPAYFEHVGAAATRP